MFWKRYVLMLLVTNGADTVFAQFNKDSISSPFVLYERRVQFNNYMQQQTIAATMNGVLDSTTEDNYVNACWAISQFVITNVAVENGFNKLFAQYQQLQYNTKRSFLEAVYATYPAKYTPQVLKLVSIETHPKLLAMQLVYLQRAGINKTELQLMLQTTFPNYQNNALLQATYWHLVNTTNNTLPSITALFAHQATHKLPVVYSFQRSNRNYAGMAIVQFSNGTFATQNGTIITVQQLARSASNLPYFLTNGSTPQGAYSIVGIAISKNNFIGPTPNLQLVMPYEDDSLYFHFNTDTSISTQQKYTQLFPESWQAYKPMQEVVIAGKVGRTEIIAHGTTIDPDYFKQFPFYPLTPTLGCLCAKETWNIFNGKIDKSDQFTLANTFAKDPKQKGVLYVINIDDKQEPVTLKDIEAWVKAYEKNNINN